MARIDLDAARAARRESKGEASSIVLGGKEYVLPVELPFEVAEYLGEVAVSANGGEDDPAYAGKVAKAVNRAVEAMLGPEAYAAFKAERPSLEDLTLLVEEVVKAYGFADVGESEASAT